jgi:hypothetical protein
MHSRKVTGDCLTNCYPQHEQGADLALIRLILDQYGSVPEKLREFETRTYTKGHANKLKKLRCNFSTRQHFFSLRITDMRNSLSSYSTPSINSYKNRLDEAMEKYMFRFEMPSTISNPMEV